MSMVAILTFSHSGSQFIINPERNSSRLHPLSLYHHGEWARQAVKRSEPVVKAQSDCLE